MRKTSFSLCMSFIFMMSVIPISAQQVSQESAMQKALSFFNETDSPASSARKAPRKTPQLKLANNSNALYIFNDESNGGFVIVSGDERMPDILGYSYEGRFDIDNLPNNLLAWLDGYAAQVDYLRMHPETKTSPHRRVQGASIAPMLDCEWDQWWPYNLMCPSEFPTGCVATTMAQIMYYHKWPEQTRTAIHGYTDEFGMVLSDYPIMPIDWDNMMPSYHDGEDYPQEQLDAVAQLMVLCGASVRMNYSQDVSATLIDKVVKSFPRYFGYDKDLSLIYSEEYDLNAWNQLIYDELSDNRPVIYGGSSETYGHVFVVDGYDGNDYFHLNWGWGGSMNGNFLLTALPDFNEEQCAIIGIQPTTTPLPDAYGVLENGTMTLYYDTEKDTRSGQVFPNLATVFPDYSSDIETLRCPQDPEMTACIIDPSFAEFELETLYSFFSECENLKSITGLKYLNTSHVTDMTGMFFQCHSLETIDFNGFQTDGVQSMASLFSGCNSLKKLELSGFNTESVIFMDGMFCGCSSLEELDLNSFNTENTALMTCMFEYCSALKSLDLSSFNTKNLLEMYAMFEGCSSLTDLNLSGFNTENVIEMAFTFRYCSSLKNLDLSSFNTENVITMWAMFEGCTSLESLDLSNFNTGKVGEMYDMFDMCYALKTLDVSSFNTSNVSSMHFMFRECESLESLDLRGFYTNNVTDMYAMFACCYSLKNLDLSSFNTSNVTTMSSMFGGCGALTAINLSSFNTDNVIDMSGMFENCGSLKELDLSSFNTSNVKDMNAMFNGCGSLESLDLSNFDTSNVENMWCTFSNCGSLKSLDLSGFNTSNVTTMYGMFVSCESLTTLDLSSFNTENVKDMDLMFNRCVSLKTLDLSGFNTSNVTSMNLLFLGCNSLESIDLHNFITDKVTGMNMMFRECHALKNINISGFNTLNVTDMSYMFTDCMSLESLDLSSFNTSNVNSMSNMFNGCWYLESLDLSNFNTSNVNDMNGMFNGCWSLASIYVSNDWNTKSVENGDGMFNDCNRLVGEMGTNYSEEHTGLDYAHIDGGPDNPGYLSDWKMADNRLKFNDLTMNAGVRESTIVTLKQINRKYTTIQFDLQLPVELSMEIYDLIAEQIGEMTFSVEQQEDGTLRFIVNCSNTIKSGDIFSLAIRADKKAAAGNYEYRLKNIILSDAYGNETKLEDAVASAKVFPPVTVTAHNIIREYGEPNEELTFDISESYALGAPTISCEADSSSPAGNYAIVVGQGDIEADTVTLVNGTLTITKAPLSIAAGTYSKKQGDPMPEFTLSYDGFKNDETADVLTTQPTVSCEATEVSTPGEYEVLVSGAEAENYEISYVAGKLIVTEADPVVITAISCTKKYGEANPTFEFTVEGAVLSGTPEISCEATETSPIGNYDIVVKQGTVENFNVSFICGTLTIEPAPLEIAVQDAVRVYGEENPEFALIYKGFVNGEDETVLTTQPTVQTAAVLTSDTGEYELEVSGAESKNYAISYINGTLTIEKAPQKIIWEQEFTEEVMTGDTIALTAESSSNLPVFYVLNSNDVAILFEEDGNWFISCTNEGILVIRATQEGDKNHLAAEDVVKKIVIIVNSIGNISTDNNHERYYRMDGIETESLSNGFHVVVTKNADGTRTIKKVFIR